MTTLIVPEIGYTPTQTARFLGVCTKTVYRAMENNLLPYGARMGKKGRYILGSEIIKFSQR